MPFFLVWNREWRIPYPSVAALEIAKRFMNKGALIEKEQVLEKDRRHRVLLYIGQRQLACGQRDTIQQHCDSGTNVFSLRFR